MDDDPAIFGIDSEDPVAETLDDEDESALPPADDGEDEEEDEEGL